MTVRLGDAEKRYYGRVADLLNDRDDEEEVDSTFTENVLRQIEADGVSRVFCDKDGSRAVEQLVQTCKSDVAFLRALLEPVVADFHSVAKDRCGSHPTEALLKAMGRHIVLNRSSTNADESLETIFLGVFEDMRASLSDLLTHPYACHVVCAAVQVVSGVYVAERMTRSRYSRDFRKAKLEDEGRQSGPVLERSVSIPLTFAGVLNKLGRWVCKLDNFPDMLVSACASPVLQVLLRVLMERLPKRGNKMIQKVIGNVKLSLAESDKSDENTLPEVFTSAVGSHLIGSVLELATADLHQWIWESCFEGRVLSFAVHPVANYPLQQFMAVTDSVQVALMVTELLPHLEDVLFVGHSGVVVKLTEAGLKNTSQQSEILKALLKAFHADKDAKCCVPLFLTITAYEVYSKHREKMKNDKSLARRDLLQVQGSLIVQALLKYEKPRVVVRSILNMEIDDIIWVSCDVAGSHVIDVFLTSSTVTPPRRKKLVKKLKPHLVTLCTDKHGSRVMDAIWRNSEVTMKESLAEDLLVHEAELADDFYGRIVLRNCNVAHYRRKQAVWQQKATAVAKTRELFHDILDDHGTGCAAVRQKRKRKETGKNSGLALSDSTVPEWSQKRRKKDPLNHN